MANILAIVGRPNVGKSTLFNRLTGERRAIVDSVSGVTRDRHYGKSDWNGIEFSIIDTGGYVSGSDDIFEGEIRRQCELAIGESEIILFMVDVESGVTGMDEDVALLLRQSNKTIFLVANKVDNGKRLNDIVEFYSLGLGEIYGISSMNGSGTGELLDEVVKHFSSDVDEVDDDTPRFAVAGRPNVGKSSMVNILLGEERNIVTDIAGTTRDSIYTKYNSYGFNFYLVDTAGVRKRAKVREDIEFYSVLRSVRAIENCDVCILMIDAQNGIEAQDLNILHIAVSNKKGVIIVVNKWDLMEKETNTVKEYTQTIHNRIAPFKDIPIIFTSAISKQRIFKALEIATDVYKNKTKRITTSELNETMLAYIQAFPPPSIKGKQVKIKYVTQIKTTFPAFAFFCNLPQYIKEPYKRFLENKIREHYDFSGVPIQIYIRKK